MWSRIFVLVVQMGLESEEESARKHVKFLRKKFLLEKNIPPWSGPFISSWMALAISVPLALSSYDSIILLVRVDLLLEKQSCEDSCRGRRGRNSKFLAVKSTV